MPKDHIQSNGLLTEDSNFSSILDLLANCSIFIYIGATIPFASFNDATITLVWWKLLLLAIAILTLRRLPAVVILHRWIPDIHSFREAVFVGLVIKCNASTLCCLLPLLNATVILDP